MTNYEGNGSSMRGTSNRSTGRKEEIEAFERENRYDSSGGGSHSGHSSSGRRARGGHHGKRKRRNFDTIQLIMYGIGVIIVILAISLAVKGCGKLASKEVSTEETDTTEESKKPEVTVDGISITGMTQKEAREAILKQYDWNMKVIYKDKEASVGNLMKEKVDELLEEIFAGEPEGAYEVNTDNMLDSAKAEAALISGNWDMVAKNGGITGYNKETGKFTFSQGSNGMVIDQDKLAQNIVSSIQKKDYKAKITAEVKEVKPEMTADQLKAKYKTIATYTTKTTSNSNRNENIRLACNALNGTIVKPGQEFSFNDTTGARTEAKGYKPATAYLNGEIVQEPGGGVCQVSSTLYNAVVFAGLKSTERHAHSYEPSYVTPGEDAAVSFGGPDFKFVNNSDYPIAIKTSFAKQELNISIYGVQTVKDGMKVRMSSEKTSEIDPPAPVYEEDQTLQPEEEKIVKKAVPGSRWSTYLVTYQDGKEVSREFFHNSSYRGKAATIKRNTSGVVVTTAASTEAPASTEDTNPAGPNGEIGPAEPNVPAVPGGNDGNTGGNSSPNGNQEPGNGGSSITQPGIAGPGNPFGN